MSYVGNQPARGQFRKLSDISGSFNGVLTTFTTSVPPGTSSYYVTAGSANQLLISLGGVIQQPDVDYTVSTNSITFTTAPAAGLSFFGVLMGDALNTGTPADGSVTTSKLAGNLSVGLAAGSAASPSLYFTGDSNSGIYSPGADTLAILTGGSNRVHVDSTGKVGIGVTPAAQLDVKATSGTLFRAEYTGIAQLNIGNGGSSINYYDGDTQIFRSGGGTERGRWDSSGRFLVGTSSTSASTRLVVQGSSAGSGSPAIQHLCFDGATPANGDGLGFLIFGDNAQSQGAWITARRDGGTWSASSKPSRLEFSTTADGASSPTERMRIDSAGQVLVTSRTLYTGNGSVVPFQVERTATDGELVQFLQAGTQEGAISVSGTTVTYGGGHLARWSQLPNDENPSGILKGTVMSNLDEMCEWGEEDNEQLNKTKASDVEGDPNVAGVFVSTSFSDDGPLDFFVAMTGDMIIRIAKGVTVQRGDLLMSAGDGTAKPQDDDIIRSKTIAKVTSTHITCTYEDGSYCVPCVLMAC